MAVKRTCRLCGAFLARDNHGDTCSCHGAPEDVERTEWVDGTAFVNWLDAVRPDHCEAARKKHGIKGGSSVVFTYPRHPDRDSRRLYDARHGGTPMSVHIVERICDRLELSLDDIPGAIWIENGGRGRRGIPVPEQDRTQILRAIENGEKVAHVANEYGLNPSTIQNWRREAA